MAAKVLGITVANVKDRIAKDAKLRAVWMKAKDPKAPTALEVVDRTPVKREVEDSALAEIIQSQNRVLLREGLAAAGLSQKTIDKLKAFDAFGTNSGHFLIASLDLSHKQMVFGNACLLEEGERIRENYLSDDTLAPQVRLEWQRAYNEIVDIQGKNYERILAGTQAMAKMMGKGEEKEDKRKPGFRPLTEADRGKET